MSGTCWFILFTDDHTHLSWVFLMKNKSETLHILKNFHMVQTQFSNQIQILQTDRARDYFNSVLGGTCKHMGLFIIVLALIHPNKIVSERKNRHLLDVA